MLARPNIIAALPNLFNRHRLFAPGAGSGGVVDFRIDFIRDKDRARVAKGEGRSAGMTAAETAVGFVTVQITSDPGSRRRVERVERRAQCIAVTARGGPTVG